MLAVLEIDKQSYHSIFTKMQRPNVLDAKNRKNPASPFSTLSSELRDAPGEIRGLQFVVQEASWLAVCFLSVFMNGSSIIMIWSAFFRPKPFIKK